MGKHKAVKNVAIPAWLSGKRDSVEGRFIQVGNSLLLSKEFHALSIYAQNMYLCMAMECGGKRQFEFPKSAGEKYGFPYQTYRRALAELKDSLFIRCLEDNHTTRKPNVYEFIFDWKLG